MNMVGGDESLQNGHRTDLYKQLACFPLTKPTDIPAAKCLEAMIGEGQVNKLLKLKYKQKIKVILALIWRILSNCLL